MVERPYYPPPTISPFLSVLTVGFLVGILLIALPSITGTTTAAESACSGAYTVQTGDTLLVIAERCRVSVPALLQANPQVTDPAAISAGQQLIIPASIPVTGGVPVPAGPPLAVIPNTGAVDAGEQAIVYTVVRGDTLGEIATQFGTTVQVLLQHNPEITNPRLIYPGQRIVVPGNIGIPNTGGIGGVDLSIYVVRPGDTLSEIAQSLGTTVPVLLQLNPQITNPDLIYPDQDIRIP